ncbi:hypothetical protein [Haloferula sp.]|uniref:baeRF10 domain-containing protein n=1 Tax=Haloferula sp. TaxID=2497595 RepID=UPI003C75FF5D
MDYAKLRKHLIALASLPKTDSPLVSAYFDLQQPLSAVRRDFLAWTELTRQTFAGSLRQDFDDAVEEIESWLGNATGKSAAIFSRWGEHPLLLPMTFDVPMKSRLHVDEYPVIYPLVELKDRFNRFVVVLVTSGSARIVEVNLGSHSVELLAERPALRERIGREWTREHYANHRKERDRKFVKEKIAVIEALMAKRGHNALIIAGDSRYVARLTSALPRSLQSKLIGELKTGISDQKMQAVISQAVESFLVKEREESFDAVNLLVQAVRAGGLATVGYEPTRRALLEGRASELIISAKLLHEEREELVRMASQQGIQIETVRDCELLDRNGGAGALLRYELQDSPDEVKIEAA